MSWYLSEYGITFLILFAIRYVRTLVHAVVFFFLIKPVKLVEKPRYTPADVTVLLSTILDIDIRPALKSMIANDPHEIILIVHESDVAKAQKVKESVGFDRIQIATVPKLGRRFQQLAGIKRTKTSLCVICDDDVRWHPNFLATLLTPFEDACVGAAGTNQRAIRNPHPTVWDFLGTCYLERRNFNTMTTNYIDGAISTLSGRSFAIRAKIVQDPKFEEFLINDDFFGRRIKIGDDKRYTMRLYAQGWKIKLIYSHEAVLYTESMSDSRFLGQCLRFARSHWQGNSAVVLSQSYWWRRHPWSAYATYLGTVMTPAILIDGGLYYILARALRDESKELQRQGLAIFVAWTLVMKTIKIWPHFARNPSDIKFIPAMILFSYAHGIINLWAAFTMTANSWGSRDVEQ